MKKVFSAALLLALSFASTAFAMGEEPQQPLAEKVVASIIGDIVNNPDVKKKLASFKKVGKITASLTACSSSTEAKGKDRVANVNIFCSKKGSREYLKLTGIVAFVLAPEATATPITIHTNDGVFQLAKTAIIDGKPYMMNTYFTTSN